MATSKTGARRLATQTRSKATVRRILDSAVDLISTKSPDLVTMTEIAHRSGVVIGSLYQYFADKTAIHRALLERHHEDVRHMLETQLSGVDSLAGLKQAILDTADKYFALHQEDAFFNGIWSAVQTDAALQALDAKDTLRNARYLCSISQPLMPGVNVDQLMATCALLLQFALTTGRFARILPAPLRRQTLLIFRRMIRDSFEAL